MTQHACLGNGKLTLAAAGRHALLGWLNITYHREPACFRAASAAPAMRRATSLGTLPDLKAEMLTLVTRPGLSSSKAGSMAPGGRLATSRLARPPPFG